MSKSLMNTARVALVLGLAGIITVGCGRKGELDRPSTPVEQQNVRKSDAAKKDPVAERPFILDKLM
jgi:predicted small lipoprotein YifL